MLSLSLTFALAVSFIKSIIADKPSSPLEQKLFFTESSHSLALSLTSHDQPSESLSDVKSSSYTSTAHPMRNFMFNDEEEFTQTCVRALFKEDGNMHLTKVDLELFFQGHLLAGSEYTADKFEDMSPIVQFYFARSTCEGKYSSSRVCSGLDTTVDPNEFITIPGGNLESVQDLCGDLEPVLKQIGLLQYSQSATQRQLQLQQNVGTYDSRIYVESDECKCIHVSTNSSHDHYDFGASCDQWDLEYNDQCNRANIFNGGCEPDWCCNYWCFVDSENCARPFTPALDVNMTAQLYLGGYNSTFTDIDPEDMFISYETCGNKNTYEADLIHTRASTYTLRYGLPDDSGDGYSLVTTNNETKQRGGSAYDFLWRQLKGSDKHSIELIEKKISEKSKRKFNNSYSACVHDVAIGELDICMGLFWMTSERLLLSSFSNILHNNEFYLVVERQEGRKYWDLMSTPFTPFNAWAWVGVIVDILYMALAIHIIKVITKTNFENEDEMKEYRERIFTLDSMMQATYDGIISFTSGGVANVSDDPSVPERIVVCGFAFFALVVLTAYTATSAAALVQKDYGGVYKDLGDVKSKGKNICIRDQLEDTFLGLYPDFEGNIHPHEKNIDMFGEMKKNQVNNVVSDSCVGVIIDVDGYEKVLADENTHCDTIRVGEVLLVLGDAIPVGPEYDHDVTYILEEGVSKGEYEEASVLAQEKYVGDTQCKGKTGTEAFVSDLGGDQEDQEVQLKALELMAPLLVCALTNTLGIILCLWDARKRRAMARTNISNHDKVNYGAKMAAKDEPAVQMKNYDNQHNVQSANHNQVAIERKSESKRSAQRDENETSPTKRNEIGEDDLRANYYYSIVRKYSGANADTTDYSTTKSDIVGMSNVCLPKFSY